MHAACHRLSRAGCASLAMMMAGCAARSPVDSALTTAIRQHYSAHASEEQGMCRTPEIDTIQEQRLLERSTEGGGVMMVRYSYFDSHADMDVRFDRLVHLSQPCGGISERRFVLARDDLGYRVTAMSGEERSEESVR